MRLYMYKHMDSNYLHIQGQLKLSGRECRQNASVDFTPLKHRGTSLIDLEEGGDQNSAATMTCSSKIKKEKVDLSG